jgi:sorbitol-specific phosphotransferase system component IIA
VLGRNIICRGHIYNSITYARNSWNNYTIEELRNLGLDEEKWSHLTQGISVMIEKSDPVLNQAQTFLARREAEWPEIVPSLKGFIEKLKKIIEMQESESEFDIFEESRSALKCLIEVGKITLKFNGAAEEWLRKTWIDIPILHVIIPLLEQKNLNEADIIEFHQRYLQSAKVLLEKIEQVIEAKNVVNLIGSTNRNEELKTLLDACNNLRAGELEKPIEEVNSNLEKKIRVLFHLAFSLHFSSEYITHMPESFQMRIDEIPNRGIVGLKRPLDRNLFYHLSRSEYSEIVNSKNNWGLIFEKVFYPKTREEIVNALQLTFGLDDRKAHRERLEYFRERKEKIRQAIFNADWLMSSLSSALNLAINPPGFFHEVQADNFVARVSFTGISQASSSYVWKIPIAKFEEIRSRILKMSRTLDFSEDNAIMTLFDCSIAEILIVIAELVQRKEIEVVQSQEGNLYVKIIPCYKDNSSTD